MRPTLQLDGLEDAEVIVPASSGDSVDMGDSRDGDSRDGDSPKLSTTVRIKRYGELKMKSIAKAAHQKLSAGQAKAYHSSSEEVNDFLMGAALTTGFEDKADKDSDNGHVAKLHPRAKDPNFKAILEARSRYMIIPDDSWFVMWTVLTMAIILFYMYVIPVRVSFADTSASDSFVQGAATWWAVDAVFDSIFLIDLLLNFWTIIQLPSNGYITNPSEIAIYHLTSIWFWIDVMASVPVSLIEGDPAQQSDDDGGNGSGMLAVGKVVRLNRIVKLFRVFRLLRFAKEIEKLAIINPGTLRLMRLILAFLTILHMLGCGFWYIASSQQFCDDTDYDLECTEGWSLAWSRVVEMPMRLQYAQAFYWALSATTGVGYDIEPFTEAEFTFTAICILFGVFIQALLIGSVPGAILYLDRRNITRKKTIDAMSDYMIATGVPHHLQKSVRSYFDFLHDEGIDMAMNPSQVMAVLPPSLRCRLQVATSIKGIEVVSLFKKLSGTAKIMLAQKLRTQVAMPGEYLFLQEDYGSETFILDRGRVQLTRKPKSHKLKAKIHEVMSRLLRPSFRGPDPSDTVAAAGAATAAATMADNAKAAEKAKAAKAKARAAEAKTAQNAKATERTIGAAAKAIEAEAKAAEKANAAEAKARAAEAKTAEMSKAAEEKAEKLAEDVAVSMTAMNWKPQNKARVVPAGTSESEEKSGMPRPYSPPSIQSFGEGFDHEKKPPLSPYSPTTGQRFGIHAKPRLSASQELKRMRNSNLLSTLQNAVTTGVPLLMQLGPGDFFGEAAILGRKHETSAVCIDFCALQVLEKRDMDEVCEAFPEVHRAIASHNKKRQGQFEFRNKQAATEAASIPEPDPEPVSASRRNYRNVIKSSVRLHKSLRGQVFTRKSSSCDDPKSPNSPKSLFPTYPESLSPQTKGGESRGGSELAGFGLPEASGLSGIAEIPPNLQGTPNRLAPPPPSTTPTPNSDHLSLESIQSAASEASTN